MMKVRLYVLRLETVVLAIVAAASLTRDPPCIPCSSHHDVCLSVADAPTTSRLFGRDVCFFQRWVCARRFALSIFFCSLAISVAGTRDVVPRGELCFCGTHTRAHPQSLGTLLVDSTGMNGSFCSMHRARSVRNRYRLVLIRGLRSPAHDRR